MILRKFLVKYKSSPVQVKASFWYTFCNILQKGIAFITVPIYVRILTTTEYGQYSVFLSWKEILIIFATLNLYCGVFTKAMVDYKDDRDRYTSCIQGLSTIITISVFLLYLILKEFWNTLFAMDTITICLLFLYFIFYPAFSFWSVRQRVENRYVQMVSVTLIVAILTPLVSIVLLYTTTLRSEAVIFGYLLVQCLIGFLFYVIHFIRGRVFYIKDYWIKAIKFNIPLIPHYLSLIILGQSDRVMISHYSGDDKVAIYNLAYQVSMVMNVITGAINNTLVPWSYEKLKFKQYSQLKNVSTKLCLALSVCTIGIILIAPEIVSILGTKEYYEAIWVIPAVAISCYFTFCYNLFSTIEFYYNVTQLVMVASVVGAILNIALNALLIPVFGYIIAGYTTLICYFVFMIMHYIFMKKICDNEIKGIVPYNITFIWYSSVLLCIGSLIIGVIYEITTIRYSLILLISIFLIIKRRYFFNLISEIK